MGIFAHCVSVLSVKIALNHCGKRQRRSIFFLHDFLPFGFLVGESNVEQKRGGWDVLKKSGIGVPSMPVCFHAQPSANGTRKHCNSFAVQSSDDALALASALQICGNQIMSIG